MGQHLRRLCPVLLPARPSAAPAALSVLKRTLSDVGTAPRVVYSRLHGVSFSILLLSTFLCLSTYRVSLVDSILLDHRGSFSLSFL